MGCDASGSAEVRRRRAIVKDICEEAGYPLTKALGKYGKEVTRLLVRTVMEIVNGPNYSWGWSDDVTKKVLMATAWDAVNTIRKAKQQQKKKRKSKSKMCTSPDDDEDGSEYEYDAELYDHERPEDDADQECSIPPSVTEGLSPDKTFTESTSSVAWNSTAHDICTNNASGEYPRNKRGSREARDASLPFSEGVEASNSSYIDPQEMLVFQSVDDSGTVEWKQLNLENVFEDLVAKSANGVVVKKVRKKVRGSSLVSPVAMTNIDIRQDLSKGHSSANGVEHTTLDITPNMMPNATLVISSNVEHNTSSPSPVDINCPIIQ